MKKVCKIIRARFLQNLLLANDKKSTDYRILYFFDDKSVLEIGKVRKRSQPRQVFILPYQIPVCLTGDDSRCFEAIVRIGDKNQISNGFSLSDGQIDSLQLIKSRMKPWLMLSDSEHLYIVFVNLLYELRVQMMNQKQSIEALIALAITKLVDNIELHNSANSTSPIAKITERMYENPAKDFDLCSIADEIGYSPQYLKKLFIKYKRHGIREYINHLRIDNATLFLTFMDISIEEVAIVCGFPNRHTFTRCFKMQIGLTPMEYRQCMKQDRTFDFGVYPSEE